MFFKKLLSIIIALFFPVLLSAITFLPVNALGAASGTAELEVISDPETGCVSAVKGAVNLTSDDTSYWDYIWPNGTLAEYGYYIDGQRSGNQQNIVFWYSCSHQDDDYCLENQFGRERVILDSSHFPGLSAGLHEVSIRLTDIYHIRGAWPFNDPKKRVGGIIAEKSCHIYVDENGCQTLVPDEELNRGQNRKRCASMQLDPINIGIGNLYQAETDFSFPTVKGFFGFKRAYNSRSASDGVLGFGCTHNYSASVVTDYNEDKHLKIQRGDGGVTKFTQSIPAVYPNTDNIEVIQYRSLSDPASYVFEYKSYDASGGTVTGWKQHRPDGAEYHFNADGKLVKITADSSVTDLTYLNDQLHTVTDNATGRIITFIYDNSRIDKIAGPVTEAVPDGIWVDYDYVNGNITEVTYPDGSGHIYEYDDPGDEHNLTAKKDKTGRQLSSWTYDAHDRAYINTAYDGRGGSIEYQAGSKVKVTDAYGVERTYTYKIINGQVMVTDVEGEPDCTGCVNGTPIRYEHDLDMNVTEKEYANGRIDKFEDFDARGNARTVRYAAGDPDERVVYKTWHPSLNSVLSRREAGLLQGDKETIYDYDDPDADGDTDAPNENPTLHKYRRIEKGFTQNANGDTVPYEYITTYDYFDNGRLKSIDGPESGDQDKTSYTYHADGSLNTVTQPLIGTLTYTDYDAAGNVGTVTDVCGVAAQYKYDGRNRRISTSKNGHVDAASYNTAGQKEYDIVGGVSENGAVTGGIKTEYEYYDDPDEPYKFGRLKKTVCFSDDYRFYDYDDQGDRIEASIYETHEGVTKKQLYLRYDYQGDAENPAPKPGKLWKEIYPNESATVYEYDTMGNMESVTDAEGKITAYGYDRFNRLGTMTEAAHLAEEFRALTDYQYDTHGNLRQVTDAEVNQTVYVYDDQGRIVTRTSPDTGVTRYVYDAAGNLTTLTDAENITKTFQYDYLNRLTQIICPDTELNIGYSYDQGAFGKGHLTGSAFPDGIADFTFNADGLRQSKTTVINSLSYETGYTYHPFGLAETVTYPSDLTVEYVPDNNGQITDVNINGQPFITDIQYRPFGPLTLMAMENQTLIMQQSYDLRYQTKSITVFKIPQENADATESSADSSFPEPTEPAFALKTETGPESAIKANISGKNQPPGFMPENVKKKRRFKNKKLRKKMPHRQTKNGPGRKLNKKMAPDFRLKKGPENKFIEGMKPKLRSKKVLEAEPGKVISASPPLTQSMNSNGDKGVIADPLRGNGDNYYLADYEYTYYDNGNVKTVDGLSIPGMSGHTSSYTLVPNKGNRLESVTTGDRAVTYSYDDNGCITSDGTRTFVYNQHNRLIKVKEGETVIAEYAYNGFNQRIKKVASGITTHYHYDQWGCLIAESKGDGTPLRDYIYLNGERIAMKIYGNQAGYYYFINDHLGTPQQIIDSEGTVVWKAAYQPFGEAQILVETVVNNFRFAGQYFDSETGLHYNHHRYYVPQTGRYLTPDPIGLDGGINLFSYVLNDPLNWIDPEGLRLRLTGSSEEKQRLFDILTGMGCGQLTMDSSGNISGSFSEDECSPCQCLKEIIQSPKYVKAGFSEEAYLYGGASWSNRNATASLAPEYKKNGQTYYTYTQKPRSWREWPGGGPQVPYHAEGALAHELLGHACDFVRGDNGQHEGNAKNQANKIRKMHGWPERWR